MTCDEAFDALTDVTRARSEELERHLGHCPRCQQMREVLQPALALLAPADATESAGESGGAPNGRAARTRMAPDALADAETAAETLRRPTSSTSMPTVQPSPWLGTVVAIVLLLAISGIGFATLATASRSRAEAAVACLWQKRGATVTSPSGRAISSRQVVMSCVACHSDVKME